MIPFPTDGRLCIGGVEIAIHAPPHIRLRVENPFYQPFFHGCAETGEKNRVPIHLICEGLPDITHATKVFDTIDAWSLYHDESGFWLQSALAADRQPYWIARFKREATRADLYCRRIESDPGHEDAIQLPFSYPLDQLLLMYHLAARGGALVHAAGMIEAGKAYLFAGVSGAGKSTFSELLQAAGSERLLSDERVIVREIKNQVTAFGTPWPGTSAIAANDQAPLAGIFLLTQAVSNHIKKLEPVAAADRLLPMLSIPWYDPETAAGIIAFMRRVTRAAPVYEMCFRPDVSAVDYLLGFVNTHP
ncbi:MAG: hypothetical protein JXA62_09370 [Candidatus Aminicenantes bacterium]|nr:hypothetical protein [Candidatus Aminicenantes bacterium]